MQKRVKDKLIIAVTGMCSRLSRSYTSHACQPAVRYLSTSHFRAAACLSTHYPHQQHSARTNGYTSGSLAGNHCEQDFCL